jgi:endonuclease G
MNFFTGVAPVLAVIAGILFTSVAGNGLDVSGPDDSGIKSVAVSSEITVYGGLPVATKPSAKFKALDNIGYEVGYSEKRRNPVWVAYRVDSEVKGKNLPRPRKFETDTRTSAGVGHYDYSKSGYDRGHMAPNHVIGTRYGRDAQLETFLMSNICPQSPKLNRQVWKDLEEVEANRFSQTFGDVWVITGPVFDDSVQFLNNSHGGSDIEIPDAFYKVIIDEVPDKTGPAGALTPRVLAFIIPQDVDGTELPIEFLTSVDKIEADTGLDLMPQLPDDVEDRVESIVADRLW